MKPILTRLFTGICLLLASQAFGQVLTTSFVVTQPTVAPYPIGSHIIVELRVTNFTGMVSMQFPITYNKDVMRFDSLTNGVFDNWGPANSVSYPTQGRVGISWQADLGNNPDGITLPNNTAIFRLHFTGLADGSAPLTISSHPGNAPQIPVEFAKLVGGPLNPFQYNISSGTVNVPVGTGQASYTGFKIIANTIYIPQGERGCMPITVNDFNSIISMQWALHWDNTVLDFECTRNYNLQGWSNQGFSLSTQVPATLLCIYEDPTTAGQTRANRARIVDVCFKAIGAPGATSTITIDGVGFGPGSGSSEAFNSSSVNVWEDGGPNGASGISAPIHIIVTPPSPNDVAISVDQINAAPGTQGCVGVKVKNFASMTNAEFALKYKSSEITFASTQFGANPLNLQASNVTHVPPPPGGDGFLRFLWVNANGGTLPDDTDIFSVCFNVPAGTPVGTQSDIVFTSTACPGITGIGVARANGGVPVALNAGWIKAQQSGPTLTPTPVNCHGGSTGSINLANPPAATATNYAWAGPNSYTSNVQNPSGLAAGTYTVTVTYVGNSTATATTIVTQPAAPLSQTNTTTLVSCFGGNDGTITLNPAGGTAPYTYNWAGNITTKDRANLTSNIYTVTITDNNGCTLVASITVSGFPAIAVNNPTVTNVTCAGLSNGSITVNATGGAPPLSYQWNTGATGNPLNNLASGTYTVTVVDNNGCSSQPQSIFVAAGSSMNSNLVNKTDVRCMGTPTGSATINVTGGAAPLSYCWSTGPGPCTSTVQNPNNLPAGTYTVIVTDANGCTSTIQNITIAPPPSALTVTGTSTPSPCFDTPSGSISVTPAGGWGNYTYAWATFPAVPTPSPVGGGTYTVTVTDANMCTATHAVTVSGSPAITQNAMVQHVTCFGQNNGGINLNLAGGNPAYQVVWSNTTLTGPNISNLEPGSYQPTVTDAQGCTKVFAAVVVNGPTELLVSTTISDANPNDGAIDLQILSGGTAPFTYLWSNWATTQDISNLAVGTYTVTITDANQCVRSFMFVVPSGNVVAASTVLSVKNTCDEDGCIFLEIPQTASTAFPLTLNWGFGFQDNVNTLSPSICDLKAGNYNVTITAANGNSTVLNALVTQLDPANVNSTVSPVFSSIVINGKITLSPTGVQCPNLQYQWGAPLNATTNEVSNLNVGTYFVTITNPCSGCVSEESYTVGYGPVYGSATVVNPDCASQPTGSITPIIQGGHLPYIYDWTGPNGFTSNLSTISQLGPGVYNLTAMDQDGQTYLQSYTLTATSPLNITNVNELSNYGGFQVSGEGICDGVATVAFTPGIGNSSILWSNGVTVANNTTLCGGAYSVTVTDAAGCASVWTDALTAPAAISMAPISDGVGCHDDCDGVARVHVAGGVGPYSVRWSTGQFDPLVTANGFSQAVNLCGGDYAVTITDANMVQRSFTVNVPQPPIIEIDFAPTAPRNFNACDGDLLANVTGAVPPLTIVWSGSFGHSGNDIRAENLCSGEFVEFYIVDANGCTAYAADTIPYPEDGCFRVSPIITPGVQDGKNDNVFITCIETSIENTLEIYNRWGQLVFQTENYTNDAGDRQHNWDGLTRNGAPYAEGVYYYVLTYKFVDDLGQERSGTRKGAINLLR